VFHGTGGAYTTFNITNIEAHSGFEVTGVTQAITNIFCYLPEYPGSTIDNPTSASAFTTEAIDHYKNYGWIRWMWWENAWNNTATMTSSNRATPSNTQIAYSSLEGLHGTEEGVPLEWTVAFSMAAGTGIWINLPCLEDSTFSYTTAVANYLYSTVPAGVPIYLERANEIWNGTGACDSVWTAAADAMFSSNQTVAYYSYQAHNTATIFRNVFGSRYGTDVRLIRAWQGTGNGVYVQTLIDQYYANQPGWTISATNGAGGDFWALAQAPYMCGGACFSSGEYEDTVAQIESTLSTDAPLQVWGNASEEIGSIALKDGLYHVAYEGGWQTNAESSQLVNAGAAIMDTSSPGMQGVMNTYTQSVANSTFNGWTVFEGGVDANDSPSSDALDPVDELSDVYPITAATSPRFASILNYVVGWTPARNVVTTAGSTVSGLNCADSSSSVSSTYPNLGGNGYAGAAPCGDAPNYGTAGEITFTVWSASARSTTLVVNFTNTGSAGSTELEYGSAPAGYSILGGSSNPTLVTIPTGTNENVTIGTFDLAAGWNYVTLGYPDHAQGSITINSLTFN
jgi:hypothetical protein